MHSADARTICGEVLTGMPVLMNADAVERGSGSTPRTHSQGFSLPGRACQALLDMTPTGLGSGGQPGGLVELDDVLVTLARPVNLPQSGGEAFVDFQRRIPSAQGIQAVARSRAGTPLAETFQRAADHGEY